MKLKYRLLLLFIVYFLLLLPLVLLNISSANAGELDAWEFNIMGITDRDFKNRDWKMIAIGIVSSYGVHELGHMATGKLMGTDPYFNKLVAYAGDGYQDLNDDQRALYHGGGFLAQTLVGGILTAIPKTRHMDFTLGFNTFSSMTGFAYGITGGMGASRDDNSDVITLDRYGYNGTAIAFSSGLINGGLTYISLNKDK